jgi:cephalosporin-C deacetylase-like acetyl esterase
MNPYSYKHVEPQAKLHLEQTARKYLRYTVDFPTAHPTHYNENNTVRGEYFQPHADGKVPLVILVHGMGDRSVIPSKALAKSLAKQGMACFVLYLVLHSSRMPPKLKREGLRVLTPDEWFESYQISVIDVRQVIDWANTRSEVNKERVAVIGISFGGFISAIAMGIDNRIKAGVLLITAGNLEKIALLSKTLARRWGYSRTEAEFNDRQSRYARYRAEVAKKGFENVNPEERGFVTDAMTFAYSLRKRPLIMINALWDEVIPKQATLDFWEACGKPAISWFPGGHITIWLWYPLINWKVARFLKSAFKL